jgi:hypothetical protein
MPRHAQSCSKVPCSVQESQLEHFLYLFLVWMYIWASLPACINYSDLAAVKHFDPLKHSSFWKTLLSILSSQFSKIFASFIPSHTNITCFFYLKQTSIGAVIFTPCSFDTNRLKLNRTHSMSPVDLELQNDQALAVLSIILPLFLWFLSCCYHSFSWAWNSRGFLVLQSTKSASTKNIYFSEIC